MRFELTILGCGSALPANGRNPSSQILRTDKEMVMIDCGEGTQTRMRRYGLKMQSIDIICISHMHGDHYLGLPGLLSSSNLLGRKKEMTIIGPPGIQEMLEMHCRHAGMRFAFPIHYVQTGAKGGDIEMQTKSLRIQGFPLDHKIATTGFRFTEKPRPRRLDPSALERYEVPLKVRGAIARGEDYIRDDGKRIPNETLSSAPRAPRSYAYCSDTAYLESVVEQVHACDALYHECTFMESEKERAERTRHSTAKQAAAIAKEAKVGRLLMGHYSARYDDLRPLLDEARSVFAESHLSEEGMSIDFHRM
jgi:ribonuclease Z